MKLRALAVLAVAASWTNVAVAQAPPTKPSARVDPRFGAIARVLAEHGAASPYFGGRGLAADVSTEGVGALLRFTRSLSPQEIDALAAKGVRWLWREGEVVRAGHVYGAMVAFDALAALDAAPAFVSAEVAWHPVVLRPLDVTIAEIGGAAAQSLPADEAGGEGALIGAIDSGVDVLHPHFFYADGGAFAWIDADGDGQPTAGVDFVDYDRNGVGDFNEVLQVLDGAQVFVGGVDGDDGALDVARDWVYVDANGDGRRNAGLADGFTEFDPGYGEPCFVADDANRDGALDPNERFLLLGTSKVLRYVTPERTYLRGRDMIAAEEAARAGEPFHGTAVASILVGGQRPHARVGVAPGAELVMYSVHPARGFDDAGQLAAIADAQASGLDVLLHEWTNPFTAPMDGGGNIEEAMRVAREAGVVQVNPLGNMNLSRKHIDFTVAAAAGATLPFVVTDGYEVAGELYPYASIWASIYWRSEQTASFTLQLPTGEAAPIPPDGTIVRVGAANVQAVAATSSRNTRQVTITIWSDATDVGLPAGQWRLGVEAPLGGAFVGRITDYWSGWGVGVHWVNATQDRGTAAYPATADAAFGVAAYGGRAVIAADGTGPHELRNYSGRGPRIDGAPMADIAAPDDPIAAFGASQSWLDGGAARHWFATFGGTSGAAPHVAGAAALMRAQDPTTTPGEIEARLLASARRDQYTAAQMPDDAWGAGKLDAFAAVHGRTARTGNRPPQVVLTLGPNGVLSAADSADPDGDPLHFRWDFDYDGSWDTEWDTEPEVRPASFGPIVRLDVRDDAGEFSGAVLVIDAAAPEVEDGADPTGDAGGAPAARRDRPCGCRSVDEGVGSAWLGALMLVVARRRRPRSIQGAHR